MMLAVPLFPVNFSLAVADNFGWLFALEYFFTWQYLKTERVCKPGYDDRRSDEQLLNGNVSLMYFVEMPDPAESKTGLEVLNQAELMAQLPTSKRLARGGTELTISRIAGNGPSEILEDAKQPLK